MTPSEFAHFLRAKLPNHETGENVTTAGAKFWQDTANNLSLDEILTVLAVFDTCHRWHGKEITDENSGAEEYVA